VNFLYDRFFATRALLGTPESCKGLVSDLAGIGVARSPACSTSVPEPTRCWRCCRTWLGWRRASLPGCARNRARGRAGRRGRQRRRAVPGELAAAVAVTAHRCRRVMAGVARRGWSRTRAGVAPRGGRAALLEQPGELVRSRYRRGSATSRTAATWTRPTRWMTWDSVGWCDWCSSSPRTTIRCGCGW
jgi:hypothetical protein